MKLFFVKEDSLYKIFKTLERIPTWKNVEISIDPEHSLFVNERRGTQLKEIIDNKWLNVTFITKSEKIKRFFDEVGLNVFLQETSTIKKILNVWYIFIFNIKKFHLHAYYKKNYVFYVVFFFESLFVLWILYLLYILIAPNATLEVSPSKQVDSIVYNFRYYPNNDMTYQQSSQYLSIPYYTGYIDYKYDLNISVSNIKYLQNPSQGQIKVINNTERDYSFLPNTRFITDDWLLFKITRWLNLPAAFNWVPWEARITVIAMEKDDMWSLMWPRWNIKQNTLMYIKNLKQSFFLKDIHAIAIEDFEWWSLSSEWVITSWDINLLSWKLYDYINNNKVDIVKSNFRLNDTILLTLDDIISTEILNINLPDNVWEKSSAVKGSITARMVFSYVQREDLVEAFKTYSLQRPSDKVKTLNIDKNSLTFFYEDDTVKQLNNLYIIPTKINIIQGYDFEKDVNGIMDDVREKIAWKTKKEAINILLDSQEVSSANIQIRPLWYATIPRIKSRINIKVNNEN